MFTDARKYTIKRRVEMNKIEKARKIFKNAFEKDDYFKQVYISNVAMLLHDRYGITDYERRNKAGEDIINLIFLS